VSNDFPTKWSEVAGLPRVLRDPDKRPHVKRTEKRGRWILVEAFWVETPWGPCGAYPKFLFDQATGVFNLWDCSACLVHDALCIHHVNLDGIVLTRPQIDMVYRWINERSWHTMNRKLATIRYYGVRTYDHRPFKKVTLAKPIPPHAYWLYTHLKDTETA